MKISFALVVFFSFSISASAQERTQIEPQDTTLTLLRMKNPELLLEEPIVILPLTFALAQPEQNKQMSLYQTFAGTPQSFAWENNTPSDLTAPLMLQLYQSPAEKAFHISLGAAGTAGALYMAYKHVKKYGLK